MYTQVSIDKEILWNGSYVRPIVTLESAEGKRAQIVVDDACYVLLIRKTELNKKFYSPTAWWFKEAATALREYLENTTSND